MVVKNKSGILRNTDKPWEIQYLVRTEKWSKEGIGYTHPYYWGHHKSYKTFDAVVDAWCQLTKSYGKFGCGMKVVYRINRIDFTEYRQFI